MSCSYRLCAWIANLISARSPTSSRKLNTKQDAVGEQVRLSDHSAEYHVLVCAVEAVHHEVNDVALRYLERLALEYAQAVAQALQLLVYLAVFERANVDSLTICGMSPSTLMPPHEYMPV